MTKKEYYEKIKDDVQQIVFKNELVMAFKERFPDESKTDIEATKKVIEKDTEFIKFIDEQIAKCE